MAYTGIVVSAVALLMSACAADRQLVGAVHPTATEFRQVAARHQAKGAIQHKRSAMGSDFVAARKKPAHTSAASTPVSIVQPSSDATTRGISRRNSAGYIPAASVEDSDARAQKSQHETDERVRRDIERARRITNSICSGC